MSDGSSADRATGDSSKKRKQSEGPEYIPKKCPHGRQKSLCKECGGAGICTHGRIPCKCKECGGGTYCIHGKRRTVCRECGGGSLCSHDRLRWECKECDGASVCIHGRQKRICKECGGVGICTHGKRRTVCRECGGGSFCTHGKRRAVCKDCSSHLFCVHDRRKTRCKECGGSSMCTHGKQRSGCKECSSHLFCVHGRRHKSCKDCASATPSSSAELGSAAAVVEPQVAPPTLDEAGGTDEGDRSTQGRRLCDHGRLKSKCKTCIAANVCIHGKRTTLCKECGGGGLCTHGKERAGCKECGGSRICIHQKYRQNCKECSSHLFCVHGRRHKLCKECASATPSSSAEPGSAAAVVDPQMEPPTILLLPEAQASKSDEAAGTEGEVLATWEPIETEPSKPTSPQQEPEYDSEDIQADCAGMALSRTCAHCNKDLDIAHFGLSVGGEYSPHCNDCAYEIQRRDTPLGAAAWD